MLTLLKARLKYSSSVLLMLVVSFAAGLWLFQPWIQGPRHVDAIETASTESNAQDFTLNAYHKGKDQITIDEGNNVWVHPGETLTIQDYPVHVANDVGTVQVLKVTPHVVVAKVHIIYWGRLLFAKFVHGLLILLAALFLTAGIGTAIEGYRDEKKEWKANPHKLSDFFLEAWTYVSTYGSSEERKEYLERILLIHQHYQKLDSVDKIRLEEETRNALGEIIASMKSDNLSRFSEIIGLPHKEHS